MRPESNSPSPAQRPVQAGARKANSYQLIPSGHHPAKRDDHPAALRLEVMRQPRSPVAADDEATGRAYASTPLGMS
jgi:hypothetical protein